jgi:hypothetical protein
VTFEAIGLGANERTRNGARRLLTRAALNEHARNPLFSLSK